MNCIFILLYEGLPDLLRIITNLTREQLYTIWKFEIPCCSIRYVP